jgi:hypothetical protein
MRKLAIRLLILSMATTALVVAPIVAPVEAAMSSTSKETKKKKKTTYRSPATGDPRSSNPFSSNMYDDFDRRNAGGGGGY